MGLFSGLKRLKQLRRILNATRYDAAATTAENARYWSFADGQSANASNTLATRKRIRERARYEAANDAYCRGMVATVVGDTIGNGPRPQLGSKQFSEIERAFIRWSDAVRLPEKLRVLRQAKIIDGEGFAIFSTNPRIAHEVKLDVIPIESDRVTSDWRCDDFLSDGIEYDAFRNPISYSVLRYHPGDLIGKPWVYDKVAAQNVIHWYRQDRPEQARGVSELMPALELFAQLRRYTLAVIAAAETAADFAAVLYTDSPAGGEAMPAQPMDTIPLVKRMATTLPDGWKVGQIKAEQPVTNYPEFKREILGEIGRALCVPVNVITGDSSQHNYASGRLDFQTYHRAIRIEQAHCESAVMSRIWNAWTREYRLTVPAVALIPAPVWYWDGFEHVDPNKEAAAQRTRLSSLTSSLASEYAKQGKDWEDEIRQIARERELMRELDIDFNEGFNKTVSESESVSIVREEEE